MPATALTLAFVLIVATLPALAQRGGGGRSERIDVMQMPRPIEALDTVWIEEMTSLEVRDALRAGKTTALVLAGGIEENGPYLTTGKHNHVLRVVGEAIARKLGNALIVPIVTIEPGDPATRTTPGTVIVSRPTYKAWLSDIATSLRTQGFENIVMIADSGGNVTPMREVTEALNSSWNGDKATVHYIDEAYNYGEILAYQNEVLKAKEVRFSEGYHDNYYITSMIMNDNLDYVRLNQRIKANKASINGISLLPVEKSLAHGRALIEMRADVSVAAIKKAVADASSN
jgi:creatinine amidohydrolase/Fe(II)-dependent formamide hydrolase-like protein